MGKKRRSKVKEKIGWKKDQRDKHPQRVDTRLEKIKKIDYDNVNKRLLNENRRAVKRFNRRWEI